MKWEKKGLIYVPDGSMEWSSSHAQIPTPIQLDKNTIRVFFATRNIDGKTQTGYVDLDIENPLKVKKVASKPVINLGKPGLHDDSGAMPFSVIKTKTKYQFYYSGWHIPTTVGYDLSIAMAETEDLNKFKKFSDGPLISKNIYEPYWAAAPCVLKEENLYKMWYISCYGWVTIKDKLEPVYHIKYAESTDGVNWELNNHIAVNINYENEALGRPWVIKEDGIYKMWYSSRGSNNYRNKNGEHYTLGYAESLDGKKWIRMDEKSGITSSIDGWDSEMIEYASIFIYKDKKYMFYNGNGFGASGFGYAVMENK